jgi:hypothetical protein
MRYSEALRDHQGGFLRRYGGSFDGVTGTMAAALASGAAVFAQRFDEALADGVVQIDWIHLHYVCLVAFTAPVTAGRALVLKRGASATADPAGGAATTHMGDELGGSGGLAGRVATTGALTMTGITLESAVRRRLLLAHAGAAGNDYDEIWSFADDPLYLSPGESIALVAEQAFDAAGTWQLSVTGHATLVGPVASGF